MANPYTWSDGFYIDMVVQERRNSIANALTHRYGNGTQDFTLNKAQFSTKTDMHMESFWSIEWLCQTINLSCYGEWAWYDHDALIWQGQTSVRFLSSCLSSNCNDTGSRTSSLIAKRIKKIRTEPGKQIPEHFRSWKILNIKK